MVDAAAEIAGPDKLARGARCVAPADGGNRVVETLRCPVSDGRPEVFDHCGRVPSVFTTSLHLFELQHGEYQANDQQ